MQAARREAWDEGHAAGWQSRHDDWASGHVPSGVHESDAVNPYSVPEPLISPEVRAAWNGMFPGTREALDALTIRKEQP